MNTIGIDMISSETKERNPNGTFKKGHVIDIETRKKISDSVRKNPNLYWLGKKRPDLAVALKGIKRSEETKQKNREAKLKNPTRHWLGKKRPEITGENFWNWKGDNVGYAGLHFWVRKQYGQSMRCEHCDVVKESTRKIHWANVTGIYRRGRENWKRLCVSCHKNFDLGNFTF